MKALFVLLFAALPAFAHAQGQGNARVRGWYGLTAESAPFTGMEPDQVAASLASWGVNLVFGGFRDAPLANALANHGFETNRDGKSLAIELATDETYDAVRDAIVETGVRLYRLAPRRGGLTDIFRSMDDDD